MINIKIEDETKALEKLAQQLSDKNLNVANVRAINVAIRKAKTQYRRQVAARYNLKYADTANIPVSNNATYSKPEGTIKGDPKPVSLSRFNPEFKKKHTIKGNKKRTRDGKKYKTTFDSKTFQIEGVSVEILKGQKKRIPFAFMVQSDKPGVGMQVWARGSYSGGKFNTSKERMPITPLKTVSPFSSLTNEDIQNNTEVRATEDMGKEFERQVNLLLRK